MRLSATCVAAFAVLALCSCHRSHLPPGVARIVGDWGPARAGTDYSNEFKDDGRYVLHSDTGNSEGTWTLTSVDGDTVVVETHVNGKQDHVQLKFRDDGTVFWTSLDTNDGEVYQRR